MFERVRNFDWREKLFNVDAVRSSIGLIFHPERVKPDFVWGDLSEANLEEALAGIELIILDIDLTLTGEGEDFIHEKVNAKFEEILQLREQGNLKVAGLTNKTYPRNIVLAERYQISICEAGKNKKPNPISYREVCEKMEVKDYEKVLFIDDNLLTGIKGGKDLGMKTALVNYKNLLRGKRERIKAKLIGRWFEQQFLKLVFGENPFAEEKS